MTHGRLLLLSSKTSFRTEDFTGAADALGVEVVLGSDRCRTIDRMGIVQNARDSLALSFRKPAEAATAIEEYHRAKPIDALVAADDAATTVGAEAAIRLGLPFNSPECVRSARDKAELRTRLASSGCLSPHFCILPASTLPHEAAQRVETAVGFPCVIKPRTLSMSRGVIRADDQAGFASAYERVTRMLRTPEVKKLAGVITDSVLVESYVPGEEVALEGLVTRGTLELLAVFDKPDPLEGPFFEETIYVTPSRKSAVVHSELVRVTEAACRALGIQHGPVHAELRLSPQGPCLVELAPRSIGGLCSRALRFATGQSLEALIIQHAMGHDVRSTTALEGRASGVMMLPIPKAGVLHQVRGIDDARRVAGIEDIVLTIDLGRKVTPLPEGDSYLGFIFARGERPEEVEAALRAAHARLVLDIGPDLPTL